ncbi:hypothetical protein [Clostridium weizhouense]|uniref:Uncharacterized protein n=1 Tax=Clostridium weizhouense TaxID=2859781 RepID=A0ABS7ATC7_9CLOT|nr:hypothetical protein [Clostridium weizhouense]MBW6411343.1 hypothetical protein [Clostridium weizhouense]
MNQNNFTLYYPTIEFRNPMWLWCAAILWDKVYRIVPSGYIPKDSDNIRELIECSDFIKPIDPKQYSKTSIEGFMEFMNDEKKAWACALETARYKNDKYINMHKDKVDVKLRKMILSKNINSKEWLGVNEDIASLYMLYLAGVIADKNNLVLSTDSSEAWCGRNFFQYEGKIDSECLDDDLTALSAVTISGIIPNSIINISPKELIKFRNNSGDERKNFYQSISDLNNALSSCCDKQIIADILNEHIVKIKNSKKEYKKRMRDIKVSGFLGVRTAVIPIAIPVIESIKTISEPMKNKLNLLGVGIGIAGACFDINRSIAKEKKNHECNYLLELQRRVINPNFGYQRLDDSNIHIGYHNLLNYELNHFIYD